MGKKTNWSGAEDQALCRAWLSAGDAVAHTHAPAATLGESRASTFWGLVYQFFHAELVTAVDRPQNGLKIRWTRINRDVQKFAWILREVRVSSGSGSESESGGDEDEQQSVEVAKELFFRQYDAKFLFEACWKLLRLSPKWNQLLATGAGAVLMPTAHASSASAASGPTALDGPDSAAPAIVSAPIAVTVAGRPLTIAETPVRFGKATETSASGTSTSASGSSSSHNGSTESGRLYKRRAASMSEVSDPNPLRQLQEVTSCLVGEMRRRNELLEEQNAIALFRLEVDDERADDSEKTLAREYFELLRRRYLKRMRATVALRVEASGNGSQPSAQIDDESAANVVLARDARTVGDAGDIESDTDSPRRQLVGTVATAVPTATQHLQAVGPAE